MNRVNNDILCIILKKDESNFINVGRISKRFRQFYTINGIVTTTNINTMKNMVFDAIKREDISLFRYIYETAFFHHISFEDEYLFLEIMREIISQNKLVIYRAFYDIMDQDLRSGFIRDMTTVDVQYEMVTCNRVEMIKHSLNHFTYTEKPQWHKDSLMRSLLDYVTDIKFFEFIYGEHLKRDPWDSEVREVIMRGVLSANIDLLDYMYGKYYMITINYFKDIYYDPLRAAAHYNKVDVLQWAYDKNLIVVHRNYLSTSIVRTALIYEKQEVFIWAMKTYGVERIGDIWKFVTRSVTYNMMDFIHTYKPVNTEDYSLYMNILHNVAWYNQDNCVKCLHWLRDHKVKITAEVHELVSTIDDVSISSIFDF